MQELHSHKLTIHVCFVCLGNTCRSPFAAQYAQQHFAASNYRFWSCGINAQNNSSPSQVAIQAAANIAQIDLSKHKAQAITTLLTQNILFWIAFSPEIAEQLHQNWKIDKAHIRLICPQGIADPFGKDLDGYTKTYTQIAKIINDKLPNLVELS